MTAFAPEENSRAVFCKGRTNPPKNTTGIDTPGFWITSSTLARETSLCPKSINTGTQKICIASSKVAASVSMGED